MGAVRDQKDRTVWRWTGSGDEVSVSFWSLPQGSEEDCARYDGSRGWLWSDTPCTARLNFICQHREYQVFSHYYRITQWLYKCHLHYYRNIYT